MKRLETIFLCLVLAICMFIFPQTKICAAEVQGDGIPVYRLYNPDNGEHLYTADVNEKKVLYEECGWGYEGIAWYAPTSGNPIYRLYNSVLGNHLYTADLNEVQTLISTDSSWNLDYDGIPLFYSGGETPIYRAYNRKLSGIHHLTTDKNEYDTLPTYGWIQEGVSLSAVSLGNPIATTYYDRNVDTGETENGSVIPIYRLYNPNNGEHLYTADVNEKKVLYGEKGWGYEGIAWYAPASGNPVYRLYNSILGNHLYTTDLNEIQTLTSGDSGWNLDYNGDSLFYSGGEMPIYRVYNRELSGMHHLTADKNEYDALPTYGWAQEGDSLSAASLGNPILTTYCEGKEATWSELINNYFNKSETDLFQKMDAKSFVVLWKDIDFDLEKGNPLNAYTDLEYAVMTPDELENKLDNMENWYNKEAFEKDKNAGDPSLLAMWAYIYLDNWYWTNAGKHLEENRTYRSADNRIGYTYLYKDGYSDDNIVAIIIYKNY